MSSDPPTYGSAARIAWIVDQLHRRPEGLSYRQIEQRLGISARTVLRYVNVLEEAKIARRQAVPGPDGVSEHGNLLWGLRLWER